MGLKTAQLVRDLKRLEHLALDTSVLIYQLEDIEPYSELTAAALATIAGGSPRGLISLVSVTELLVKPFAQAQDERTAVCEQFLHALPNVSLVELRYPIAKEGARLRAQYGLRTPDALLAATALREKGHGLLTNDKAFLKLHGKELTVLLLDHYL